MLNTNSKRYKENLKNYLKPCIEDKIKEYGHCLPENIYKWCVDTAKIELGHIKNDQKRLEHWLSGLALGIDFYNSDIIDAAEKLHECDIPENKMEIIIDGWFNHIAFKIMQFAKN